MEQRQQLSQFCSFGLLINYDSYRNNVTGKWQYGRPTQFRGGVLADSMGLGKSLSMIALMSNDTPCSFDQALYSGSAKNAPTLLVVPPSRKCNRVKRRPHDNI